MESVQLVSYRCTPHPVRTPSILACPTHRPCTKLVIFVMMQKPFIFHDAEALLAGPHTHTPGRFDVHVSQKFKAHLPEVQSALCREKKEKKMLLLKKNRHLLTIITTPL